MKVGPHIFYHPLNILYSLWEGSHVEQLWKTSQHLLYLWWILATGVVASKRSNFN